jgi:hypothetical protein
MKTKKEVLLAILFYGSIWGILEASLGYLLQFLPELVSGSVMFPIAATLMYLAYKKTGDKTSIFFVALIAASFKAFNFLLPGLLPIKTYNPMIAIILQSLVVMLAVTISEKKTSFAKFTSFGLIGFSWRALFLLNISINHVITQFNFPQLATPETMLSFVFLSGLIDLAILCLIYSVATLVGNRISMKIKMNWILSLSTVFVAILVTLIPIVIKLIA